MRTTLALLFVLSLACAGCSTAVGKAVCGVVPLPGCADPVPTPVALP
jgi:hypothetical protein